jgi:hypothetical protein
MNPARTATPFRSWIPILLLCGGTALGACSATGPRLDPGRGLVTSAQTPPPDAEIFEAPTWKVGDRFVFQKGGLARLAFRVESTEKGVHRLVDEQSGLVELVGEDLSDRGQEKIDAPELTISYDPADFSFSWPLWVGKRWTCHFVRRAHNQPDLPLVVTYECDGIESVTVPAGTFRCLRVWRRARLAAQGRYVDRISLAWYAPEPGIVVRRLADSMLIEAEEIDRQ